MGQHNVKLFKDSIEFVKDKDLPIESSYAFFSRLWKIQLTQNDFYECLTHDILLDIRRSQPHKFSYLILNIISEFRSILDDKNNVDKRVHELLNLIRLVTLIMPVSFDTSIQDDFEHKFLMKNEMPEEKREDIKEEHGLPTDSLELNQRFEEIVNGKPISEQIIDILMSLTFVPSLTCDKSMKIEPSMHEIPMKFCWALGCQTKDIPYTNTLYLDKYRYELLRCMIATLSSQLFKPEEVCKEQNYENHWLDYFTSTNTPYTNCFLASLFNVAMRYDPVGWGVPYNHVLSSADDQEALMNAAIHLLIIIINYNAASIKQPAQHRQLDPNEIEIEYDNEDSKGKRKENVFLTKFNSYTLEDYKFIFDGILRLLTNPIQSTHTYLPNSTKRLDCYQELFILFYQLIKVNRAFLYRISKLDNFIDIIYPILHFSYEARKDTAQHIILQVGISILFFLSGERSFSIALNKKFDKYVYISIPKFSGNYADFLILVLFYLFADSNMKSLRESYLSIIANVSPYIKSLSLITSQKLLVLFSSLSREKFLYEEENNYRYMFFMLEIFNNILQYQYEGNIFLVYSIITKKDDFFKLFKLTRKHIPVEKVQESKNEENDKVIDNQQQEQPPQEDKATDKFVPTKEWYQRWVTKLPILTIITFLQGILPQLEEVIKGDSQDQNLIVDFLKKTTPVGLLPVPHRLIIRHFNTRKDANHWLRRSIWVTVYLRNMSPMKLFGNLKTVLFEVRTTSKK